MTAGYISLKLLFAKPHIKVPVPRSVETLHNLALKVFSTLHFISVNSPIFEVVRRDFLSHLKSLWLKRIMVKMDDSLLNRAVSLSM